MPDPESLIGRNLELRDQRIRELEAERDRLREALRRLLVNCFGQGPSDPPKYATWAQAWRECRQALGEEEASQ